MNKICVLLISLLLLAGIGGQSMAQDKDAPSLTPEDMESAGAYIIPSPAMIFSALNALSEGVTWMDYIQVNSNVEYATQSQLALNLGNRVAMGMILVQAENKDQMSRLGPVLFDLADGLGIKEIDLEARLDKLYRLSQDGKWSELRRELDGLQSEVKEELNTRLQDPNLVILMSLGGWLKGLQIVSDVVNAQYNPDSSTLLREPANDDIGLVAYFIKQIEQFPQELKGDEIVQQIYAKLPEIKNLCSVGTDEPIAQENVAQLAAISSELNQLIEQ